MICGWCGRMQCVRPVLTENKNETTGVVRIVKTWLCRKCRTDVYKSLIDGSTIHKKQNQEGEV